MPRAGWADVVFYHTHAGLYITSTVGTYWFQECSGLLVFTYMYMYVYQGGLETSPGASQPRSSYSYNPATTYYSGD